MLRRTRGRDGCYDDILALTSEGSLKLVWAWEPRVTRIIKDKQKVLCLNKRDLIRKGDSKSPMEQLQSKRGMGLFRYIRETYDRVRIWQEGLLGILSSTVFCIICAFHHL